jgi:cysteine-S-conjugate beta-lyase
MSDQPKALATRLIHHAYEAPAGFMAPQPAVHKASTVIFKDVAAMRARDWRHKTGYTYGLHGTPTTFMLEERIATLEGGHQCLLVPSGLAAIALVNQALLGQGDEVLLPDNVYGPSLALARAELARWGIGHRLYDPLDVDAAVALMGPNTRLMWVEAPGSVTMEFPPLAALIAAARERGICVALDDTWGSGIAFQPFELGADIVMQALTKYPSGGGDVLMGAVPHAPGPGRGRQRRRGGAARAAVHRPALRRASRSRHGAGAVVRRARRGGHRAAPGAAGGAGP